jgi:hypothetical protein
MRAHDPLEQWRRQGQQIERERAAARFADQTERRHRAHAHDASEAALLRAEFEQRIVVLEAENAALREDLLLLSRSVGDAFEQLGDSHVMVSRETREELRELRHEVAKLGSVATELRADGGFRFPGEGKKSEARKH